jgi:hypothetical protein
MYFAGTFRKRMKVADEIGVVKSSQCAVLQNTRWNEILGK